MRALWWIGGGLTAGAVLALLGYGAYYSTSFFGDGAIPLGVRAASLALVIGVLLLLMAVAVQRLRPSSPREIEEEQAIKGVEF